MKTGKISVIIPVYNGEKWLAECIESVLAQSLSDFEVLIVDDNSTDKTAEIAGKFAEKDKRVRVISRKERGVSTARNRGIAESEGEYLTFVDADDRLDGRMLESLKDMLVKEKSDMAVCSFLNWDGDPDVKAGNAPGQTVTVDKNTYVSDYLLNGATRCWSILYRRSTVKEVRFRENLTIGEDLMFLVDLLANLRKVSITDYQGYFYRINQNGVMLRPFTHSYMDEIKSWRMAASVIGWDYPDLKANVNSKLAVSAMLVAGKLSRLSRADRSRNQDCIEKCRWTVKEALKVPGARDALPPGYKIKTNLFTACPNGYLELYHMWKS